MSEHFYGEITIPMAFIDDEIALKIQEEFGINSSDVGSRSCYDIDVNQWREGYYSFSNAMALYGKFEELEDLLTEKRIPFDRYSESFFEYPPQRLYYRPTNHEDTQNIEITLTTDGCNFIETHLLKPLLDLEPALAVVALQRLIQLSDPDIVPLEEYVQELQGPEASQGEGV